MTAGTSSEALRALGAVVWWSFCLHLAQGKALPHPGSGGRSITLSILWSKGMGALVQKSFDLLELLGHKGWEAQYHLKSLVAKGIGSAGKKELRPA